ncbi:uncharacterized protein K452DRAFT_236134 [Aplosporella prunicola CBS 121167]|uniref:Uncharacterized protein n=1 Tax=Aplosporella prunicola CBS 121167 TaxID=1176127 RepID=A0A6A6B1Y2_9PEZI|nr:uncharacterized protein K452DRAFT_236134 [Aplosporella prunicola CBS 121167]KAF2137234.1 hypothetical protein K452DRAFT_236134 [Aplosporella prunicola CBS 121167]
MSPSSSNNYSYEYFNVTFPQPYIAHVEINRPEKLNAFIEIMWQNLAKIFTQLSHDPSVRAILLTGAGDRAFTAGLDVHAAAQSGPLADAEKEGASQDVARRALYNLRHITDFQACITAIEKCEKPTLTLLHSLAYGLALDIALSTDLRITTTSTRFAIKEVDIGLAADIGTLTRLPKAVGSMAWVKDVALTGRVFGAEEALRVGLVSEVVQGGKEEGVRRALEVLGVVAQKSPVAVRGTKEILDYGWGRTVEEGLRYTAVWNSAMIQTQDIKDALLSGIQKRKPTFEKL